MTAIAPTAPRTAVVVVAGLVAIVIGALVVGRVVPQPLLLTTAMMVFLGTSYVADKLGKDVAVVAVAVVVSGNAWAFGAWCSFQGFALWPALTLTAVIAGAVVMAGLKTRLDLVALSTKLMPLSTLMLAAMVLSWAFVKRGVAGAVLALAFVAWGAFWLFIEVAQVGSDDGDDAAVARAAGILDRITEIAWNALVFWARVAPDDG
jgi:hypothetical protein